MPDAELLDTHPHPGALAARVLVGVERREESRPPGSAILGTPAGATVFRRRAFVGAGGDPPRLFLGGEKTLLALDLASQGWPLIYSDALVVYHSPSLMRDASARRATVARNAVWTAWPRFPLMVSLGLTWRLAPRIWREAGGMRGRIHIVGGLAWTLHERHVIPRRVDARRRHVKAAARAAPHARPPPTRHRLGGNAVQLSN